MDRLCSICARGGSKGVPGKNVRILAGKPLIAHSIEQALASGLFSDIAVSSDSVEILDIARKYGATILVKRPVEMATDNAGKLQVIIHCFKAAEKESGKVYQTIVDLDSTSPLRLVADIVESVKLLEESGASNVLTAAPARKSPYFNLVEFNDNGILGVSKSLPKTVLRRQDSPKCYDMNASIYPFRRDALTDATSVFFDDTKLYVMPEERSIDIDSELEFQFVEFLMKKRNDV